MKNWNIAMNMVMEMKAAAAATGCDLWAYDKDSDTCISYWARLAGGKYQEMLKPLSVTENAGMVLLRYHSVTAVADGKTVSSDAFWDLYGGLYRECRSLVIDVVNDCLVLTPFRKFRNINEGEEVSYEKVREMIDRASCVEFSDKLDGSMQSARYYRGSIIMSGSQALDPEKSWRLKDGYRMLLENPGYTRMLEDHPDKTFVFEYISKKDQHVVWYDKEGLFLIGARDVGTGKEDPYAKVLEYARRYQVPSTKVFDKTLDQVMSELDEKSSNEAEGFVVNIDGFKVKVKYNDYVFMHRTLSSLTSEKLVIQSIAEGTFDDMVSKVPEAYRERVMDTAAAVYDYMEKTEAAVREAYGAAPKESRKEFMVWVNNNADPRIRGFVREKYLGHGYCVLKKGGAYMKIGDILSRKEGK